MFPQPLNRFVAWILQLLESSLASLNLSGHFTAFNPFSSTGNFYTRRRLATLIVSVVFAWMLYLLYPIKPALSLPFTPMLETAEVNASAIFEKALVATERGDYATAERYWTEIIDQYPTNPAVWSNRGNALVSQQKLQEALSDYNQSIALAPEQPDAYLNRGAALEGLKQWDAAILDYDHVLELNPKDAAAYNNRGNAKAGKGDWQAAIADFQEAIKLNPSFAMARANYALVLYQVGQVDTAIHQFRNLVRKYPQFADMRAALSAALWVEGYQGEAESQWVSAVALDSRYRDLNWVQTIRRWPPAITSALNQFLSLQ